MTRPAGAVNKANLEFTQKFDALSKKFVDPLELMFRIAAHHKDGKTFKGKELEIGKDWEPQHRVEAARQLLNYRYPKLKAVEIKEKVDNQATFRWETDNDSTDNNSVPATSGTTSPAH